MGKCKISSGNEGDYGCVFHSLSGDIKTLADLQPFKIRSCQICVHNDNDAQDAKAFKEARRMPAADSYCGGGGMVTGGSEHFEVISALDMDVACCLTIRCVLLRQTWLMRQRESHSHNSCVLRSSIGLKYGSKKGFGRYFTYPRASSTSTRQCPRLFSMSSMVSADRTIRSSWKQPGPLGCEPYQIRRRRSEQRTLCGASRIGSSPTIILHL